MSSAVNRLVRKALAEESVKAAVAPGRDLDRFDSSAAEKLRQETGGVVGGRSNPEVASEARRDARLEVLRVVRPGEGRGRAGLLDARGLGVRVVRDLVVAQPEPAKQ